MPGCRSTQSQMQYRTWYICTVHLGLNYLDTCKVGFSGSVQLKQAMCMSETCDRVSGNIVFLLHGIVQFQYKCTYFEGPTCLFSKPHPIQCKCTSYTILNIKTHSRNYTMYCNRLVSKLAQAIASTHNALWRCKVTRPFAFTRAVIQVQEKTGPPPHQV